MGYERREYPEKSWSVSKMDIFRDCALKYYFSVYGGWNGWEYDASERTKHIYRLTKITNMYALSGEIIHRKIKENILGIEKKPEELFNDIITELRHLTKESFYKKEYFVSNPKKVVMLHEYYYNLYDNKDRKELAVKITERVKNSVFNLTESETYKNLKAANTKIIELDDENFNYFIFDGIKIYAILDALYINSGKIFIGDWKTGKKDKEKNDLQMAVYIMYFIEKYGQKLPEIKADNIICLNEYINDGSSYKRNISEDELTKTKEYIKTSEEILGRYLENPDINKPKEEIFFKPNPGKRCANCNFIEICDFHEIKKY